MSPGMKLKDLLCVAFLATVSIELSQAQTIKTTPPNKKATAEKKNLTQQLPFADARNMTLMIFLTDPPPMPGMRPIAQRWPRGSGVWIGKNGYIATCQHVIAGWSGPLKIGFARGPYVTEGTSSITIGSAINVYDAVLVASDPDMDVAILKSDLTPDKIQLMPLVTGFSERTLITPQIPLSPKGAIIKVDLPQAGETLLLSGYPIATSTESALILQIGTATGLYFDNSPLTPTGKSASKLRIMLSLVSNPGNSGGPVLDATGKVIGLLEGNLPSPIRDERSRQVLTPRVKLDDAGNAILDAHGQPQFEIAPLAQNSGISVAVPAKFIEDLAKKNNIDLQ